MSPTHTVPDSEFQEEADASDRRPDKGLTPAQYHERMKIHYYMNKMYNLLVKHKYECDLMISEIQHNFHLLEPQSGEAEIDEVTAETSGAAEKTATTTFTDLSPGFENEITSMMEPSRWSATTTDTTLADFFKRPIRIAQLQWLVNTGLNLNIDPWTLYFRNIRVVNRINNFRNMRCRLCVKVVVASTPFHYGRAMLSYYPIPQGLQSYDDFNLITASQRPHIMINPAENQGGSMILPFYFYKDSLDITIGEYDKMGEFWLKSIANLKHANAGTDPINISIFAWAEDVVLSHPTQNSNVDLVPQSGEFSDAPVSNAATAIANVAGALVKVPVIGMYAKATEMGARAVSSMAKMFGYSRPRILDDVKPVNVNYVGNCANTNAKDSALTTALDLKQELSISPANHGLGNVDEMAFNTIVCRESYLGFSAFDSSRVVDGSILNIAVTPDQFVFVNGKLYLPSMAFVSQCFKFWRGTMRFRLSVVCSKFHRGRIRVVYDPKKANPPVEFNTTYQYIIDLAENTDITIDIPWSNPRGYLNTYPIHSLMEGGNQFSYNFSSPTVDYADNEMNGELSAYILDPITGPSTENDVGIAFFGSMLPDSQFRDPTEENIENWSYWEPQGGEMDQASDTKPTCGPADVVFGEATPAHDLVYFGESIHSFRTLLKRYSFVGLWFVPDGLNYSMILRRIWNLLGYRGDDPNGVHLDTTGGTNTPCNIYSQTILHYMLPCFAGWSGALRYKFFLNGSYNASGAEIAQNFRFDRLAKPANYGIFSVGAALSQRENYQKFMALYGNATMNGSVVTPRKMKNVLEVENPFYSNLRFYPGTKLDGLSTAAFASSHQLLFHSGPNSGPQGGTTPNHIESWIAVGEDFNATFWLGPPNIYLRKYPFST